MKIKIKDNISEALFPSVIACLIFFVLVMFFSSDANASVDTVIDPTEDIGITIPSVRTDETTPFAVSEVAELKMYCGMATGDYPNETSFTDIPQRDVTVVADFTGYPNGNAYCVLTVVDLQGRESLYSNELTIPINTLPKPSTLIIRWRNLQDQ